MSNRYGPKPVTNGLGYCFDAGNYKSVAPGQSGTHTINDLTGNDGATTTGAQHNTGGWMDFTGDTMNPGTIAATEPADAGNMYQSIDFWYYYTSVKTSCCDTIFGRHHFRCFQIGTNLYFMHGTNTGGTEAYQHPSIAVTANTWYHIVCTRENVDGTNKFRLYKNNSKAMDFAYNPTGYLWGYDTEGWNTSGTGHSNIRVAMSKIYNKTLSADEVNQNFEAHRGRFGI